MAIFGIAGRQYTTFRKSYKNIIAFTTLLARRRILVLHWKSKNPAKVSLWFSDLTQFIQLEKIKYSHKLLLVGGDGLKSVVPDLLRIVGMFEL